VAWV